MDLEEDDDLPDLTPRRVAAEGCVDFVPTCDDSPEGRRVAYSIRGPRDVVLSGPLRGGRARGRRFGTREEARAWAVARFGSHRVADVPPSLGMWAFLIRNLKQEVTT